MLRSFNELGGSLTCNVLNCGETETLLIYNRIWIIKINEAIYDILNEIKSIV